MSVETIGLDVGEDEGDTDDILDSLGQDLEGIDITSQGDEVLEQAAEYMEKHMDDTLIQQAVTQGMDLREYASQIKSDLRKEENKTLVQYTKEGVKMARLYLEICDCDDVLKNMEEMLSTFQLNLSSISSEIDYLQEASTSMSQKLKNRKEVVSELGQVVERLAVSELMIKQIIESPVQEQGFSDALGELSQRIDYLKELDFLGAVAADDVRSVLEKLRLKAISKIRENIFEKIYQCRKPMSNYQVPQNNLIKFKHFNEFLMAHSRETAVQVREEYVATLGKMHFSYFKEYHARLQKLEFEEKSTKDDVIAGEESGGRRVSHMFGSNKHHLTNKSTVFTLGTRDEVLKTFENPFIVPHTPKSELATQKLEPHAPKLEPRFTYEALFRSMQYTLTDTCCHEYLFLQDFFQLGKGTQQLFDSIFDRTLSFLNNCVESSVSSSFDSVSLLLCINLVHLFNELMERRGVSTLNLYWYRLLELLWPRFFAIIELNVNSIRNADPQKLSHFDTRPHYITRRYAEFTAAIISINSNHPDARVDAALSDLHEELQKFLLQLAAEFLTRKDQLVFLINNYDMMLSVLKERGVGEAGASIGDVRSFQSLLETNTREFVEHTLQTVFKDLVLFVREAEPLVEAGNLEQMSFYETNIRKIAKNFAHNWKKIVDNISKEVLQSFTNFREGGVIFQEILSQMLHYYNRFHKLMSNPPFKSLHLKADLLSNHQLMVEVRKLKPHFMS